MKDGALLSLFSFKPVAEHSGSNTHSCCYQTFLIITIYSNVFTTTLQFVWLSNYNGLQSWAKMSFPSKKKPLSIRKVPCGELLHTWTNKKPTRKDFCYLQNEFIYVCCLFKALKKELFAINWKHVSPIYRLTNTTEPTGQEQKINCW